jgi:ATP-dependent RNA helicase DHX37/DHR1
MIIEVGLGVDVYTLHSSLSSEEQQRVFEKTKRRKVVISTNISETSLTIPDIVFVIDCGREKYKISDYMGMYAYKIGFISKSSATQRMGRAGRTGDGVCYRLYSGATYDSFPEYNPPKILVDSLEDHLLTLKSMGIDDLMKFPFLVRPEAVQIEIAERRLRDLGALNEKGKVTSLGKRMSQFPLRSRLSRLLCVSTELSNEMVLLVSSLSIDLDLCRNKNNSMYFIEFKSDLVAKMQMIRDFINSSGKRVFCIEIGVSYRALSECAKIYHYLMRIKDPSYRLSACDCDLSMENSDKLRRIVYYGFCDNLAVRAGDSYFYKNEEVYLSRESFGIDSRHVVFDCLIYGNRKIYMKNVTAVDEEWL